MVSKMYPALCWFCLWDLTLQPESWNEKQELDALQDPGLIHMAWQKSKWETIVLAEGPSVADCRLQAECRVGVDGAWLVLQASLPSFAGAISSVFCNKCNFK